MASGNKSKQQREINSKKEEYQNTR